jgi:hypothetical protein
MRPSDTSAPPSSAASPRSATRPISPPGFSRSHVPARRAGDIRLESLGAVEVKGRSEPVEIFALASEA